MFTELTYWGLILLFVAAVWYSRHYVKKQNKKRSQERHMYGLEIKKTILELVQEGTEGRFTEVDILYFAEHVRPDQTEFTELNNQEFLAELKRNTYAPHSIYCVLVWIVDGTYVCHLADKSRLRGQRPFVEEKQACAFIIELDAKAAVAAM